MDGTTFRDGICIRWLTQHNRNNNPTLRKVSEMELCNGNGVVVYVSGDSYNLQEHSVVIVRGGYVLKDYQGLDTIWLKIY